MELRDLCQINALSGDEGRLRKAIIEEAKKHCQSVEIDRKGNVICRKKQVEGRTNVVIAAHMDEVGFIINGHTDDGLLRFASIGGIDPRVCISKWVMKDDLKGVIGAKAIHLQTPADRERVLQLSELYIDIGARDKAEAEEKAPLGSYFAFWQEYEETEGGFVITKALDDRVGCFNMLRLMKNEYNVNLSFAFVTQEEVGLKGSMCAAHLLQGDISIVLEGTSANDMGDVDPRFHVTSAGEGVAVSFMDGASIADIELYRKMLSWAEALDIKAQPKKGVSGGNDAGSFQRAGAGSRTVVLSVPCRYIHSPSSMAKLSDIEAQYELCDTFLSNEF